MIRFLIKGILNDRSRSLLPVIVVSLGVMLTVLMVCWLNGILGESLVMSANFTTGHMKVMTRAYSAEESQMPNDLALIGTSELKEELESSFPGTEWVERIRFGGLIDFPDDSNETRVQGPAVGWAIDLLSPGNKEIQRFNIAGSVVKGEIPDEPGEALISDDLAEKFEVAPGDIFTLFGSTMDGGMAFKNFTVSGTVHFGTTAIDRGAMIIDITDAQEAFYMDDAAGEILGYFTDGYYDDEEASEISETFNSRYAGDDDIFAPLMLSLRDQEGMAFFLDYSKNFGSILIFVFVLAMSVVLWNAGLLGGLRRYTEFGIRLAMGEEKKHIYRTLLYEGLIIGIIGSITGTIVGLAISFYIQKVGIDLGDMFQSSSMMMPSVIRTKVSSAAYYIGFIPGVFSMLLGNALSGMAIYKRKTAQLFKELEV